MADKADILSQNVALTAKLDASGIDVKAKSRAVAGFDRLVGSLFDLLAASIEGAADNRRLEDNIKGQLKTAQANLALQQIQNMPDLGLTLISDLVEDTARKKINKFKIGLEAINALKEAPAICLPSNNPPHEDLDEKLDEDWMNNFIRYAEDASSERLQKLWGRVLAGEIRTPGIFSRETLRFISELDNNIANNCEWINNRIIRDWVPINNSWGGASELSIFLELQRLGILKGVGLKGAQYQITIDESGVGAIGGQFLGLVFDGQPGRIIAFDAFFVSRLGLEVLSLLHPNNEELILKELADKTDKSGLNWIAISKLLFVKDGVSHFSDNIDKIWQRESN
jgi:hypothetical protein